MNRTFLARAVATAAVAIGAIASTASTAIAQTGSRLNFEGSALVSDQPGSGGQNLLIDFLFGSPAPTIPGTPTGTVTAVPTISGVFAGDIAPDDEGTIQDVAIGPVALPMVIGTPINPFLQIGGYTFTLDEGTTGNFFGPISLFDIGTGTIATFGVRGRVFGGSLMQTYGYEGAFSAQFAGLDPADVFNAINSGGTLPVSFSAEFVITGVVPEPSTYLLMATGLVGIVGAGIMRRRQA